MLTNDDTIAAIATPAGAGGIGIIRLSGAEAPRILDVLFRRYQASEPWQSHRLYWGQIWEPASGTVLDEALAVLMRAPHSYTREQIVELHCHGGPALLSQVLAACLANGARLAERGEFTLRAFLNGALSLDEAEAVADLVSAQTGPAAQMAARQLQGALHRRLAPLEQELLALLAELTVGVDFPDDADVPRPEALLPRVAALRQGIKELLAGAAAGRIYREGLAVVLAGASNVGKSSLLNRLLQTERAIVTAAPGTTRDIIEESLNLDGLPLLLTDTAGLRELAELDEAEALGMARSRAALKAAQLALIVIDGQRGLDEVARELLAELTTADAGQSCDDSANRLPIKGRPCFLLLLNKADLLNERELVARLVELQELACDIDIAVVSAKTGAGITDLLAQIKSKALAAYEGAGREPLLNNLRHQQALLRAEEALAEAAVALTEDLPVDLVGIDLENAYQAIGEISGKTASEEVLSAIFANFCVGK